MLSKKEAVVLEILTRAGSPTFGLDLVSKSNGALKRGVVYLTLARMEEEGLVKSCLSGNFIGNTGLQKRAYWAETKGKQALQEYEDKAMPLLGWVFA